VRDGRHEDRRPEHPGRLLNYARREKLAVVLHPLDGRVRGAHKNFDRFALIVEHNGMDHLVFKHAIATIRNAARSEPSRPTIPEACSAAPS
jgi:RNA chaperone Hfq